jgi:hypothetical protein
VTSDEIRAVLRHQRERGPLPASAEGLAAWIATLQKQLPSACIELLPAGDSRAAVAQLRGLGVSAQEADGRVLLRFPADGDALDRVLHLLGLPPLAGGAAGAVLAALDPAEDAAARKPPPLSLPLRIQPAKACALGWSSDLFSLTVLIGNVSLREQDGALLPRNGGPVVAVCAEYDRPLTSLNPPSIAGYLLDDAREEGMPMLRLQAGWLRSPLRLEATSRLARSPAGRTKAVARAGRFLDQLDEAWQQRTGPALEVAWPVYRPERSGPPLDAVVGTPLPELELR